jgi:hypothetical protein
MQEEKINIDQFFDKYNLDQAKKPEFTRYINLIEKNPKIIEVYKTTIGEMLEHQSDKIFAKEKFSAGNFLKDLDSLSDNTKHHSANINVIADYAIGNLSKTGEKTLLELDSRIKHGISGIDKVKENKLASLLKTDPKIQKARDDEKQSKATQDQEKQSKSASPLKTDPKIQKARDDEKQSKATQDQEKQSKSASPLKTDPKIQKARDDEKQSKATQDQEKQTKSASPLKTDPKIQKARDDEKQSKPTQAEEKQSKPTQAEEKQSKPTQAEEKQSKSASPLNANSDFYKFMMNQDSSKLAKIFSEAKDDKLGKLSKLKPEHIIENAPKELLDRIIEVSNKIDQREKSNGVVLFVKDSIASIVGFFCTLLKTKEIPGFGGALNEFKKAFDVLSPLNEESNFYKFMMNQDSSRLAKIFSEAKDDKSGKLNKLTPEHIIENSPKELLEKIIEVSKKINQGAQINGVVLFVNSIASMVGFFCTLLKTKEIPDFGSALNDLAKCAELGVGRSSDGKNTAVKTFVDKLGLKIPESFKAKAEQNSSQDVPKTR